MEKKIEKDNLINEAKMALDVAMLKHDKMHAVAKDKSKMPYAFIIIATSALISALGMRIFGGFFKPSLLEMLGQIIMLTIMFIIIIYALSIVSKSIFKGQAKHDEFFRVAAYGSVVGFLSIFPPLAIISGIWAFIIIIVILKVVHKLTTGGAILSLIVTAIAMIIISIILIPIFAIFGLSFLFSGHSSKKIDLGDVYKKGFEMNVGTEDGEGSVQMKDGEMTIKGPDGKEMKISIPSIK